jgi:hypothetical protein
METSLVRSWSYSNRFWRWLGDQLLQACDDPEHALDVPILYYDARCVNLDWERDCEGYASNREEFVLTQATEQHRSFCDDFCAKHNYEVKPSENPVVGYFET